MSSPALTHDGAGQCDIRSYNRRRDWRPSNRRLVICASLPSAAFLRNKEREKKNAQDIGLVFGRMALSSPTLVRQTIISAAFSCGERIPHPRAGFDR
jgi:hypothetical protein